MTNPIAGTTIDTALKNADKHYNNVDDRVKAFYWLGVIVVKCLLKIAYHSKDC